MTMTKMQMTMKMPQSCQGGPNLDDEVGLVTKSDDEGAEVKLVLEVVR
jgi:hypothetical protein